MGDSHQNWIEIKPNQMKINQPQNTNEFLYIQWEDEGLEYTLKFCEGDNQEVKVVGSSMFLYDTDSNGEKDHTQITILITKELE